MRAKHIGAALLLMAMTALTGCAPHQMAPKPAGPVTAKTYGSLDDLKSDFDAAGFECPGWDHNNVMGLAEESGSCTNYQVLATFASQDDEATSISYQSPSSDEEQVSLLVGPNWYINSDDAKEIQAYLGGEVRVLEPGSDEDVPDPLAGVSTDDPAPAGFHQTGDLYVDFGSASSNTFTHTITAEVWSSMMCSSVYLEANLIAADGTIVGYTNGTLGTLPAGTVGQIRLTWTESGAATIRATKGSCN